MSPKEASYPQSFFGIFGADVQLWLKHSSALTYAKITSSGVRGKTIEEVKFKLKEDAEQVLRFTASNGLVANPTKTTLMILNHKAQVLVEIKVGKAKIIQEICSKLIGVYINENEKLEHPN